MANLSLLYNVKDYGAVGNGVVNDGPAIQLAINACFDGGGGTIFFPNGVYNVSTALITSLDSVNPNCQLYIPLHTGFGAGVLGPVIHFKGESSPNPINSPIIDIGIHNIGAVIKSTITGSGTKPAVFGSSWIVNAFGTFVNRTCVVMEDIDVRVPANASTAVSMGAINFGSLLWFQTRGQVVAQVDWPVFDTIQPGNQTYGIIFPTVGHAGDFGCNVNGTCHAIGFHRGMRLSEHLTFDRLHLAGCDGGVEFGTGGAGSGGHPVTGGQMFVYNCKYDIVLTGHGKGKFDYWGEQRSAAGKWFQNVYGIYAPSAAILNAHINYSLNESGTGDERPLVLNGTITGTYKLMNMRAATEQQLPSFTVAGVPSASPAGKQMWITNEIGGACVAYSDGTNIRRVDTNAIISAT